ncbi:papilin isoform X9 [Marmota marmota marmota]|nr:papilin isoform X9 [Marmota marmota marmota]XP_048654889.1 papilin isoform X9 [Marmota marmota marmota]XP_048654890.1 papilin isoform X9 [Marmota marmota marmota]XP_048654891.1 papilin isoform X9 [Marmota marmota marmota]XP_048654892.1 papilin isoform X9 [Marmota marmota marmota]
MRLLLLVPLLLAPAPGSSSSGRHEEEEEKDKYTCKPNTFTYMTLAPKVRRQSDTWGPWGQWSPCSRTCGGGISFRERLCYSQRRDGGSSCVGPARSHRICSTESCPDGARDFRAQQCAQFDGAEFQGQRYRWLPYYGAPNKCELNCIPKGENFYYKHKDTVVDGTPCEPGKRDVCVDGSCRVVGCDHKLDSSKKEDKCLQCGGDGTSCYPVTGTFDANDLSRGYNQIFIVPMGATSIRIEEAAASRNFLAVKNVRGEYYLNGHWTIEAAQALPVASTILQYERGAEGDLAPERLQARGPTSEPLVIELLSQEPNPGVHYEYHLPLGSPQPGVFSWSHGSWSDCSAQCGGGHQSRLVFCTIDHEAYPDHLCQRQPRPADRRPCNPQPCPQTKRISYLHRPGAWRHAGAQRVCGNSWKAGPWAPCSASCGGGSQSRSVYCVLSDGAGGQEAAEEAACAGLPGKPSTTQACNLQRCAAWSMEPWGECSVTCGAGVRRRSVTCRGDEGSLLHASACSLEDQPPLIEPCVREACPLLNVQAWHVGAWGLCSKSCSSGTRRRQVICAIGPPSHCQNLQQAKPTEVETCNPQSCHLPQEVPSVQNLHAGPRDSWMPLGPQEAPASDSRDQRWAAQERPWVQRNPRRDQGLQLSALGPAPSLQQSPHWLPPRSGSGTSDCRHSPHGCCPDGHTASLGPQWQGCPGTGALCQQSRYGCCPDGVSVAEGPQQAGCARSGSRPGSQAVSSTVPEARRPQAQQNEPSECRGSQFGCCYDNVASATGPLGEGCTGQPRYAYPVRCLLPSALGSCADWAARWYFVASVGQCNRFWYGGCHGNANNFASEQECMSSCRGPQHGPHHPEPGVSGQITHTDGGGSSPRGPQEPGPHRTGATAPRLPLPSGGLWWREQELGPGEATFGDRPGGQELGSRTPGLGGNARQPAPPSHGSSYRISLAGSQPFLVQAALGQMVQLLCPSNTSPEPQGGWQKDGHLISSDRYVEQGQSCLCESFPTVAPLTFPGTEVSGLRSALQSWDPLWEQHWGLRENSLPSGALSSHRPSFNSGTSCSLMAPWSSAPCRQRMLASIAVVATDQAVTPRRSSFVSQTRDPVQDHSSQDFSPRRDAGGLGAVSSSHPRPAARLHLDRTQPAVVDANLGQRIRLPCRAEGFPPPTIEWQRDGQPLSSPRHQLQPDGSLVISGVAMEDGGFYTCIAFNGQNRDQRWVQLRVLGELTITELPTTVTVPEGDTARLVCVVAGESVNIRWSRNGLPVQADGHRVHQSPDGTLLIHNLRAMDEGSYTCSAYRGSQAVSRSTEVKVAPAALAAQPRDPSRECIDQPELANCDLILQAQLCGNEYYSSFCCASCSRSQPHTQPTWQQG